MLKKIRKILILSLLGTILLYAKEDNSSNINTEINEIIKKSEIERKKEEKEEKRREKEEKKIKESHSGNSFKKTKQRSSFLTLSFSLSLSLFLLFSLFQITGERER